MGRQKGRVRRDGQHASSPTAPPPSSFTFLSLGFPATALPFYFFSLSSPGEKKTKVLIFLFASGKVEGETAKRLKECCGGCEGERHLLPRLLSEVSQRGSSKWECLEAGPRGPRDWYVP